MSAPNFLFTMHHVSSHHVSSCLFMHFSVLFIHYIPDNLNLEKIISKQSISKLLLRSNFTLSSEKVEFLKTRLNYIRVCSCVQWKSLWGPPLACSVPPPSLLRSTWFEIIGFIEAMLKLSFGNTETNTAVWNILVQNWEMLILMIRL